MCPWFWSGPVHTMSVIRAIKKKVYYKFVPDILMPIILSVVNYVVCCSSRVHFVNTYILFFIVQSKKRICTLRDSLHGECPSITILKLDYCSTYLSMLAKFKTVDPVSYVNVSPREREILITTPKCNNTRRGKIIWHWTPISLLLLLLLSKFNPDNTSTDRLGFGFFESGVDWRKYRVSRIFFIFLRYWWFFKV